MLRKNEGKKNKYMLNIQRELLNKYLLKCKQMDLNANALVRRFINKVINDDTNTEIDVKKITTEILTEIKQEVNK
jgi:hypothetical protein